ncbi:MAG: AAC(3) family N-acetyltransferase [Candidatus Humimicrobiaceae bacterium]
MVSLFNSISSKTGTTDITPARGMGRVAECFRKQEGVLRSSHPHYSFCARGRLARKITGEHSLDFGLGNNSPLAKIYQAGGYVLLIGVGHESNTSLHLAEYRAHYPRKKRMQVWAPVIEGGKRVEKNFMDIDLDCGDFERVGKDYERDVRLARGNIGKASARLFSQRSLVDFALKWMEKHRR